MRALTPPRASSHDRSFSSLQVDVTLNIEEYSQPLRTWLEVDGVGRQVKQRFLRFLRSFKDEHGDLLYPKLVSEMCRGAPFHVGGDIGLPARV